MTIPSECAGKATLARGLHRACAAVCGCVLLAAASTAPAQPFGIDTRASNDSLRIDEVPTGSGDNLTLVQVFPRLFFDTALGLVEIPDGSGRLVLWQRNGEVFVFPNIADPDPSSDVLGFLDLTDRADSSQGELGLLGLAFSPDYATSGQLYVHYTRLEPAVEFPGYRATSVIARYTNDNPADDSVSPATEEIILELDQPFDNHNGGSIVFGPHDDMLYIAFGDGGNEPFFGESQDTTNLLGNMLRIDVLGPPDSGLAYAIPSDNPFVGGGGPDPGTREEIFAYGLRNPFRASFDPATGVLYTGDVGESRWEEVDIVEAGGNYGWPIMEGDECLDDDDTPPPPPCDQSGLALPAAQQPRDQAVAIIGGYVYRGSRIPWLVGTYIYGDWIFGNVWGLTYDGSTVTSRTTLVSGWPHGFVSYGQDASGEVYLLNGAIYVFEETTPPEPPEDFPEQLSDIPALLNAGLGIDQTADGILPYAPVPQLWSDGTLKERFLAIPGLEQAEFSTSGGWVFPDGTVAIKNFLLPQDFRDPLGTAERIETRLLVKNEGNWFGFSYEWNEAGTDAVLLDGAKTRSFSLLDEGGAPLDYDWEYPSRAQCLQCHTDAATFVLGLNTPQMNHDFSYRASGVTDNQLRTFDQITLFDQTLPAAPSSLPRAPDPFDESDGSLGERAQAYLHANCAMCHQPGGPTPVSLDLRWETPLGGKGILDVAPSAGGLGLTDPRIVASGDPDRSVLLARMEDLGADRMPPLATSRAHTEAVELVRAWITDLGSGPQSPAQQACIVALNKAASKVSKAQAKLDARCLASHARGDIVSVVACIAEDPGSRVQRASLKLLAQQEKRCGEVPDFGPTNAAFAASAAVAGDAVLVEGLFGFAADLAFVTGDEDAVGASCQARVLAAAHKGLDAALKSFGKCKKAGLRNESIVNADGLAGCLDTVGSDAKVAKRLDKLAATLNSRCGGVDLDTRFPGDCVGSGDVGGCMAERVRCATCATLAATDGFNGDCDAFDDDTANASCAPLVVE